MKPPWRLLRKVSGPVVGCLIIILMLRWFEHSQVYHPSRMMDATGAELGRPYEDVRLRAQDGVELNGWFFPAGENARYARHVFLVCHGNAGNISDRLDTCRALLESGAGVFLFDYRGYGRSKGRPSEEGTYLDAQAAYRWLVAKGFPGTNIVVFGESLGGAVGCELALREPCGGLILQSTFTSIPDIGEELFPWLPVRWLARIRYDTHRKLPGLSIPVMVMHSREDELIGFAHGERNFGAAKEPKLFWELAGDHNDPLADREQFVAGIRKFLELVGSPALRLEP
jgi:fermentation-respiration switch protein FrsA (DUF1100 family)